MDPTLACAPIHPDLCHFELTRRVRLRRCVLRVRAGFRLRAARLEAASAPRKLGKSSFTTTAAWGHAEERYLARAPDFLYSADAGKTFNSANLGLEGHLITSAVDGIDEQTVLLAGSVHDKRTGAALSGVILRGSGLTFSRVLEVKAPPVKFGFPRVFTSLDARDESRVYCRRNRRHPLSQP